MWKKYNANRYRKTDDCVIRAISIATGRTWTDVYDEIVAEGRRKWDMPEQNHVWIGWLQKHGFKLFSVPNACPNCYSVREFAHDHPYGTYIIGDGRHVLTIIDGDWYDTWDSGDMIPTFYLRR